LQNVTTLISVFGHGLEGQVQILVNTTGTMCRKLHLKCHRV